MGQERLVADLRDELARGEVLVVVGTGVSIQAAAKAECATWDGLIRNGIEHAVGTTLLPAAEAEELRERLKSSDNEARLDVGEEISKALGAPHGEFRRWLRETAGRLPLKDRAVIDAVHALGAPIATTNYDDLLTRGRGIAHVPWTDVAAAQEILRGDRRDAVLHLHGCFDHTESVILGRQSYQQILDNHGAQAVQRGIAATRSLLFIGCGDGLSDPNLGALLQWIASAFGNTIYRHYRLCLTSEQKAPDGRLFYVAYGDQHDDLAPFLRGLVSHKPATPLPSPGYCFGREREVEEVVAALLAESPRPLPILGGPGMGKTTIALKALHDRRVAERFGARRFFVRCDGVRTRAELAAAIARALNLPITPTVEQSVLEVLARGPAALVLDNGETPLDAEDCAQVEQFLSVLATIEPLSLIVTIRGHKRPPGVPWRATTEPERLTDSAAAEAFVAASGKPKFAEDPDLPRLLVVLDGVPLAITLMARFAELFETLEPVWSRWQKKKTAILGESASHDRLKSLPVSYELSIGVLSPAAGRLLSVLAMLPEGAAHRDLEGIFADPDGPADELRRRALVFDEEGRVRMRAPLREYVAAEHPADAADERRAVEHYLVVASEGKNVGRAGGAEAAVRLRAEVANVEAIFRKNLSAPDDVIVEAVDGWGELMRFTGLGSTEPIERVAASASAAGLAKVAAQSLASLGDIVLERADQEMARAHHEEALLLYRQVGDVKGEANCIKSLGDIALDRADHETARSCYEEALPLYRQVGDVTGEANCIQSLGDIALRRLDHETARGRYEEALPLYREVRDLLGEANCILRLGDVAEAKEDRLSAESKYREALALYERTAAPYSIGWAHGRLARLATDGASRTAHVTAARNAWRSIKRDDLVAQFLAKFEDK